MKINWFPGHMKKALEVMAEEVEFIDVIIYVLDARAPFSSVNPSFTSVIGKKPIIYILNKSDLANDEQNKKWKEYFSSENTKCLILNCTQTGNAKIIKDKINEFPLRKVKRNLKKNINIPIRCMVIGVPNSGKSTLINNLCGQYKTKTGDKAGVTRGKQWVKIDENIEILDTPGTLWPDLENETIAQHLAYVGSIKNEVLDFPSLALEFIKEMPKSIFEERYSIKINDETPLEIFELICKTRGFIFKKGEYDYDRGAVAILDDFKKAKFGRITLDICGEN